MSTVSIHAPARGATCHPGPASRCSSCFNSRTREGCDAYPCTTEEWNKLFQFTHPRGVRLNGFKDEDFLETFQFTHPRGVRRAKGESEAFIQEFQFTHPRGVRPEDFIRSKGAGGFQFTHPRGVRPQEQADGTRVAVFQFTHPRGVRPPEVVRAILDRIVSIHAPARGATVSCSQTSTLS